MWQYLILSFIIIHIIKYILQKLANTSHVPSSKYSNRDVNEQFVREKTLKKIWK